MHTTIPLMHKTHGPLKRPLSRGVVRGITIGSVLVSAFTEVQAV
jgi:hypothetical protein